MPKIKLGIPLEYKKFPQYFDAWNVSSDTEIKNSLIETLLKEQAVKTVLDLTCGTGSQVFFLYKLGYKVVGSDFSAPLIEIAKAKAKDANFSIEFIVGDIRTSKVGAFDAVITIFNAVGHLTKAGFEKAIRNVAGNLHPGGIFVFDIFNLEAITDSVVQEVLPCSVAKKIGNSNVQVMQCSTVDRHLGLMTSYSSYMVQNGTNKPEIFKHKFSIQIYTALELKQMLSRCGFSLVKQIGLDGSTFSRFKTMSILTVAKKL